MLLLLLLYVYLLFGLISTSYLLIFDTMNWKMDIATGIDNWFVCIVFLGFFCCIQHRKSYLTLCSRSYGYLITHSAASLECHVGGKGHGDLTRSIKHKSGRPFDVLSVNVKTQNQYFDPTVECPRSTIKGHTLQTDKIDFVVDPEYKNGWNTKPALI